MSSKCGNEYRASERLVSKEPFPCTECTEEVSQGLFTFTMELRLEAHTGCCDTQHCTQIAEVQT